MIFSLHSRAQFIKDKRVGFMEYINKGRTCVVRLNETINNVNEKCFHWIPINVNDISEEQY